MTQQYVPDLQPYFTQTPCLGSPSCSLCATCARFTKGPRTSQHYLVAPGHKHYCRCYRSKPHTGPVVLAGDQVPR